MSKKKREFMRLVSETEQEAVIEIYGDIGGWDWEEWKEINTIKTISEELNRIKALNTNTILVKINSLGGDCDSALTIYDALRDHKAKVITQVNGYVASAATIIFMAGEERKVSKNSLFLVHKCSSWAWGNENELEATLDMQRKTNERMLSIYDEGCKKSKDEIGALMEEFNGVGKWITADEVLDYGFATEIYNDKTSATAATDYRAFAAFKYPPLPSGYELETGDKESGFFAKLMQYMGDYFSSNNKHNINETQKEMKKLNAVFPLICGLFAFKTEEDYDPEKGRTFSDAELKTLEAKITEFNTAKEKFEADKKELTDKLATMTTERDGLQAKLNAIPNPQSAAAPAASDMKEDNTYVSLQANDPIYQKLKEEYGN